jgi:hypothetical protein
MNLRDGQQEVWCGKCYGDHYTNDCPAVEGVSMPETPLRAIINHLRDEEADYLIGRCMPLLVILDENEQAIELLRDMRKYAFGEEPHEAKR